MRKINISRTVLALAQGTSLGYNSRGFLVTGEQFSTKCKTRSLGYGGPQAQHTRNHTRNYRSFELRRKG